MYVYHYSLLSHWVCRSGTGIVRGAQFSNDKLNGTEGVLLGNPLDDAADSDSSSSVSLSYAMLDSACPSLPHPCPAFLVHAKASLARSWQPEREVLTNSFPFFIVFNDSSFRPFQLFHHYTTGCHFFLFSSIAKTNQSGPDDMIYMHPSQAATTSVTGMCLAWAVLYITNQ